MTENRHARAGPSTFLLPHATKVLISSPVTSRGQRAHLNLVVRQHMLGDPHPPEGGSGTALWEGSSASVQGL